MLLSEIPRSTGSKKVKTAQDKLFALNSLNPDNLFDKVSTKESLPFKSFDDDTKFTYSVRVCYKRNFDVVSSNKDWTFGKCNFFGNYAIHKTDKSAPVYTDIGLLPWEDLGLFCFDYQVSDDKVVLGGVNFPLSEGEWVRYYSKLLSKLPDKYKCIDVIDKEVACFTMLVYHYEESDEGLVIPVWGYTLTGTPFNDYDKWTTFPDRFDSEIDEESKFTSMFVVPDSHMGKTHDYKLAH